MTARLLAGALVSLVAATAHAQDPREATPPRGLEALAAKVIPSVVRVYGAGGFTNVPAYGCGVVIDARGFVLTTWSISLRTDALKVVDHMGRRYGATIWRVDPGLGAALLKIQGTGEGFAALSLSDSSALAPGDPVASFGNPFGFLYGDEKAAISRGVVTSQHSAGRGGFRLERFPPQLETILLTDIPNNPGTQGGPLVTLDGRLVGVQGRLVESRATNTILNFALPTNSLKAFVRAGLRSPVARPELTEPAREPRRPLPEAGVRLQRAHLVRSPLAYVERVLPESPAAAAGVEPDDLIVRLADRTIRSCRDWDDALRAQGGGATELKVKRGDTVLALELVLPKAGE